ncbi:hypothetical protein E2562_038716 [Oryza meyeriana var. granulata]|uniref:Uncharacterized protein n=1 Tax=Oryza meyeriana var. granulata TaxID=110450 RepID=A0A6G1C351_9ORYZ|nr:hypothetical protein E2562_038716 [Oryza meyeriana var. granulata]
MEPPLETAGLPPARRALVYPIDVKVSVQQLVAEWILLHLWRVMIMNKTKIGTSAGAGATYRPRM